MQRANVCLVLFDYYSLFTVFWALFCLGLRGFGCLTWLGVVFCFLYFVVVRESTTERGTSEEEANKHCRPGDTGGAGVIVDKCPHWRDNAHLPLSNTHGNRSRWEIDSSVGGLGFNVRQVWHGEIAKGCNLGRNWTLGIVPAYRKGTHVRDVSGELAKQPLGEYRKGARNVRHLLLRESGREVHGKYRSHDLR